MMAALKWKHLQETINQRWQWQWWHGGIVQMQVAARNNQPEVAVAVVAWRHC